MFTTWLWWFVKDWFILALCLFVGLVGELLLWSCDQEIFELSDYASIMHNAQSVTNHHNQVVNTTRG